MRGLTLVEMLVAMTIAGIALGLIGTISLRQQRLFTDLAERSALAGQLDDATNVLPLDLRALSAANGDIRDARDTALEVRSTIASALVCDTTATGIILPPASATPVLTSVSSAMEVGDSVWLLSGPDPVGDTWLPHRVVGVGSIAGGACGPQGPRLVGAALLAPRLSLNLVPVPGSTFIGSPLRATRPLRLSLYRASDGAWYAGQRDWNNATVKFNGIQPVAGPFLAPAGGGLSFRFSDSSGQALSSPVTNPLAIALIRIELRGQTRGKHADSSIMILALRNR